MDQGKVSAGQWVAVHGCGGVGLSAVMIATALGASVIAVDIADNKLEQAKQMGAVHTINSRTVADPVEAIRKLTSRGAHVSMDALGHPETCFNSVANLRKRGRHVQIGLLLADHRHPSIPMDRVIAHELELYGSHGMQAHRYPEMLAMVASGKLQPERLITKTVDLEQGLEVLQAMNRFDATGVTIIDRF